LKIALFDEEVIAADFMISQILSIFSPIGISPVNGTNTYWTLLEKHSLPIITLQKPLLTRWDKKPQK
jgi:hypothetical protein